MSHVFIGQFVQLSSSVRKASQEVSRILTQFAPASVYSHYFQCTFSTFTITADFSASSLDCALRRAAADVH